MGLGKRKGEGRRDGEGKREGEAWEEGRRGVRGGKEEGTGVWASYLSIIRA